MITPQGGGLSAGAINVATGSLTAGSDGDIAFAWQNPHATAIIVERVVVDVTTAGAATSDVNVGAAETAVEVDQDDLIDGGAIDAIDTIDNISEAGTNGKATQRIDANGGTHDYITGTIETADAPALVGTYRVIYSVLSTV